jgi:hypothetical protein
MAWKQGFVLIVGGLALLGAGAAALRPGAVAGIRPASPSSGPGGNEPESPAPVRVSRSRPQADQALKIAREMTEILRTSAASETKKQDLEFQAGLLRQSLRAEPRTWDDVIDLLALYEPEEAALFTARLLGEGLEPDVEQKLAGLLGGGDSAILRRLALALLGRRDSGEITAALVSCLQCPDPRLRAETIEALAYRRGIAGSSSVGPVVDAALRSRAESEPDPVLRHAERCLVGDEMATAPPTPARRVPLSSSSLRSRSR